MWKGKKKGGGGEGASLFMTHGFILISHLLYQNNRYYWYKGTSSDTLNDRWARMALPVEKGNFFQSMTSLAHLLIHKELESSFRRQEWGKFAYLSHCAQDRPKKYFWRISVFSHQKSLSSTKKKKLFSQGFFVIVEISLFEHSTGYIPDIDQPC